MRCLPLLFVVFLAGCGLDLVASSPPAGSELLAGNSRIELRFDHALDPSTAERAPVSLTQGGERIPVQVRLNPTGDGLAIVPLVPLRPGITAELAVESGVQGTGRRRSRDAETLSFPVAASAAAPPQMKSNSFQLQGGTVSR